MASVPWGRRTAVGRLARFRRFHLCRAIGASRGEQRAAVKFCFLLGKNAAETVLMLKTAYKDDAMGKTQVYE
ncbi:hypothetical protein NQ318_021260 [Aromia moschata]|uniref:Uncharacterized protein n=1 Tax=Aromia moschata TaxID=1265417 RepID=A0AAV8ZEM9_9CUCU|nr:hypothetical protein NQ318_021260 [Aromia moschata]